MFRLRRAPPRPATGAIVNVDRHRRFGGLPILFTLSVFANFPGRHLFICVFPPSQGTAIRGAPKKAGRRRGGGSEEKSGGGGREDRAGPHPRASGTAAGFLEAGVGLRWGGSFIRHRGGGGRRRSTTQAVLQHSSQPGGCSSHRRDSWPAGHQYCVRTRGERAWPRSC